MTSTDFSETAAKSASGAAGMAAVSLTEGQRCLYDSVTGNRILVPAPGTPGYAAFEKFLEDLRAERGDLSSLR